ncbi:MAG TPA: bifunctional ADP-heptose synthase [Luteibaculaceae bacterium]|nr:bifunctional ADP-heptose synthase [Luteibaculaceae bacterium]
MIDSLFTGMNNLTVLVVGDLMIDAYFWGKVERISPEAPVPVVSVAKKENRLGGAANVALNLQALGAKAIVVGICGNDSNGEAMKNLLLDNSLTTKGLLPVSDRPTSIKTRVISSGQQMLRIDEEKTADLDPLDEERVMKHIDQLLAEHTVDVVLFEDYNKGLLTTRVIEHTIKAAKSLQIPIAVDPKKKNFLHYRGVTLFKPNLKELREGLKLDIEQINIDTLDDACTLLNEYLDHDISFITLSEMGVYINQRGKSGIFPAHKREIADVSGAGDTVISVAALCLGLRCDAAVLAQLSNLAGGLVCEEVGVVPIQKSKLYNEALRTLVV